MLQLKREWSCGPTRCDEGTKGAIQPDLQVSQRTQRIGLAHYAGAVLPSK